jgi:oligopeptide/dipeptide ABC transporter ATP-binding protein
VEGEPPDPAHLPQGCRFHSRCPHAMARCQEEPVLAEAAPGHHVACWLHQ